MYEYSVLKADSLMCEEQLNELGLEGWRLAAVIHIPAMYYFYFERDIGETASNPLPFNVLRKI